MPPWNPSTPRNSGPSHLPVWLADAVHQPGRVQRVFGLLGLREDHRRAIASHGGGDSAFRMVDGRHGSNLPKSRYYDVVPYDANRVKLPHRSPNDAFVNASWITEPDLGVGPSSPPAPKWIASQGPLAETLHDFFSLFTELDEPSRPRVIIQLTACYEGARCKSAPYVPSSIGQTLRFDAFVPPPSHLDRRSKPAWPRRESASPVEVTLVSTKSREDGVWRENVLSVSVSDPSTTTTRKVEVTHLECTAWSDHGVPDSIDPILALIGSAESLSHDRPIVVHCSAGVGRTGTLIALASLRRRLEQVRRQGGAVAEGAKVQKELGPLPEELRTDAVAVTVDGLRDQRVMMVQTTDQLKFVYRAFAHLWSLPVAS